MPVRFECTSLAKKAIYKYSSFPFFYRGPQSWSLEWQFQNFHFFPAATVSKCVEPELQKSLLCVWREAPSGNRKKVFPQFLKILRAGGQNFNCIIQGPPRAIGGKILATVPWPTCPQKKTLEISPKIANFKLHESLQIQKDRVNVRKSPYKWAEVQPRPLSLRASTAENQKFR